MVNVFQRLTRRAQSSSSNAQEGTPTGTAPVTATAPAQSSSHGRIRRSLSVSSNKRIRRAPAEEPSPRHLILISDTPDFDDRVIHRYQAEGFDVEYMPFTCSGDPDRDQKNLDNAVHSREDDLEAGERYAIVGMYLICLHVSDLLWNEDIFENGDRMLIKS